MKIKYKKYIFYNSNIFKKLFFYNIMFEKMQCNLLNSEIWKILSIYFPFINIDHITSFKINLFLYENNYNIYEKTYAILYFFKYIYKKCNM